MACSLEVWLPHLDFPVQQCSLVVNMKLAHLLSLPTQLRLGPVRKKGAQGSDLLPGIPHQERLLRAQVVAVLNQVPFQPLTFYNHPLGRENIKGYDIMAYSWWRFLNDSAAPPHWLVQFPMVKATVRAMDTVTDYIRKTFHKNITQFTLTGVSMGGWVSWLTAAVDSRVAAIIPIGMDFMNFTENFHHQYRAYCGWSYMLRPFYELNITCKLDTTRFSDLALQVDPVAYNERYKNISKYIIVASGDEFFHPDNSYYYFPQLEGEKYLK
ncbi:autocrine proliferation repressor protein A-like [Eublepharis macularius]|uniref:Autocrine proliferation repressor protein A-like n=1 Tax=Eublepharis macularius TaxID=481883 RepID=A0AA97KTJ9_EUBMA|nr:autocrine proliferation repressor protein A-like [Eublepharis macularius]